MNDTIQKILQNKDRILKEYSFKEAKKEDQTKETIAAAIEHTNLKPTATPDDIMALCKEANENNFRSVCIHPSYITVADEALGDSGVKIVTVVGFPLGMNSTTTKTKEAENAISLGADEVDMVINQGRLKSKSYDNVLFDIRKVVKTCGTTPVKVIIEACNLTQEEKIMACLLAKEAGAAFVKTSTGFAEHGATVEDVALMKYVVGNELKVKAAGGIRDLETAERMMSNGATLLGASSGVRILEGKTVQGDY